MTDVLLRGTVERLLSERCSFGAVEQAELDGWCSPAWDALAEAGFLLISVPVESGGSGGSIEDAMEVLRAVGRHAAPLPVAETGVLGGWLLAAAGLPIPTGPVAVVPDAAAVHVVGGRLRGEATVAWARQAKILVALAADGDELVIVAVRPDQVAIDGGANLAGEPRDRVSFDVGLDEVDRASAPDGVDGRALRLRGALTRVVLMAGAAEAMCQLTVDYANARIQFGRPIAKFQAVQHLLVTAAEQSVALSMAADVAVRAAAHGPAFREIASAKVLAEEVAHTATRAAHQAHGAMGMTREYGLHHLSRRLWSWRHEYGSGREWRRSLGAEVIRGGVDALFPGITT